MSADKSALSLLTGERSTFRGIGDPYQIYQEKRRLNALQRQKAARLQSSNRARSLALEPGQQEDGSEQRPWQGPEESDIGADATTEDADMDPSTSYLPSSAVSRGGSRSGRGRGDGSRSAQSGQSSGTSGGVRAYGQRYGNELMQPEWMTDVPNDLATNWLVMPRPEGMRCLLVTSRGRTVSWLRNGAPLHRFRSRLPGGSPESGAGSGGSVAAAAASSSDYCMLDCIFHPPNNTYYVQDLLCWRGYAMYDTTAEFRAFWLASKFQEEGLMQPPTPTCGPDAGAAAASASTAAAAAAGCSVDVDMGGSGGAAVCDSVQPGHRQEQHQAPVSFRIVPLPVRPCTLQGMRAAYGRVPPPPAAAAAAAATGAIAPAAWTDPWATFPPSEAAAGTGGGGGQFAADGAGDAAMREGGGEAIASEAVTKEAVAELQMDFLRDGLYFLHRQGHYCPGPIPTPLALVWKDLGCSRYLVDTDSNGQPLEHQTVVLSYRADRTVATEDEPPVVLGRLPEAFVASQGVKLRPGRLLRFTIRQGGIAFHEGRPAGADLQYEGPANQRRGRADSFSKILFQRLARTAPITAAVLAAAVTASEAIATAAAVTASVEGAQETCAAPAPLAEFALFGGSAVRTGDGGRGCGGEMAVE